MTNTGRNVDWELVTKIFEEALAIPPSERAAFVAELCSDQSGVLAEVIELLEAHERSDDFLLEMDPHKAILLLESADDKPQHAGPFRLLREIGRGGMGVVYLGERSDGQFDRRVAVKVIKRGMDSVAIRSRFLRERQILAALEHPHIGRLYDGGVTDGGQPYFAMEYVDGLPLTEYCDVHGLSVDQRLELFEQGCRAVQFAHQNLVVHRDLKPSNMLVTEDGRLRLLDFGIAKMLDSGAEAGQLTTMADGHRVLTPEYASPEQLRGETITTASDVYSLGIVLYELLAGRRPYTVDTRSVEELGRSLADSRILPPSIAFENTSASRSPDKNEHGQPGSVASRRGVSVARLRRRLIGDLDTIVMKALRTDPSRRYASVEALIEDLRRHANGLPIQARPESITYRSRKFVERHRVGVSIAAVVTLLLLSAVAISLNLAQEKARESAKAQQVTAFMASMFSSSDPDRAQGSEITVLELLEEGSKRIESELAGQPEVQAELMEVMGQVYMKLGLYEQSEALHRSALARRRAVFGNEHVLVARSLHRTAVTLRGQARWEEATAILREAAEMQRSLRGSDSEELATTLYDIGWIEAYRNGNYEAAEDLNRQAIAIFQKTAGYESEQVARGLYNIGWALQRQGSYEEAAALYRESLDLWRKLVGEKHRSVAKNLSGLATVHQDLGELDEAERLHRGALEIRREILAPDHPDVATSLNNLATTLRDKGDFTAAAEFFEQACEIYSGRLGEQHPYAVTCRQNLGSALAGAGRIDDALTLLRDALSFRAEKLGTRHPQYALTLVWLGDALVLGGRNEEAEGHFREALEVRSESLGGNHPETAAARVRLARTLLAREATSEAKVLLEAAVPAQESAFGPDHPTTRETRELLSLIN